MALRVLHRRRPHRAIRRRGDRDTGLDHMASVRDRLAPGSDPRVIHWSGHEQSTLETAYNAATRRHPQRSACMGLPQLVRSC